MDRQGCLILLFEAEVLMLEMSWFSGMLCIVVIRR